MIECAFCNERGNWNRVFHAEKRKPTSDKRLNFDVYQCGNCAGFVHVIWSAAEFGSLGGLHDFKVLPYPLKDKPDPSENWPQQVQRFWTQAHQSENREIWDAASVLARSAMQITLREQGANGRTLKDEIDDLASRGVLPPTMAEGASGYLVASGARSRPPQWK
jgi:hypothetical protein